MNFLWIVFLKNVTWNLLVLKLPGVCSLALQCVFPSDWGWPLLLLVLPYKSWQTDLCAGDAEFLMLLTWWSVTGMGPLPPRPWEAAWLPAPCCSHRAAWKDGKGVWVTCFWSSGLIWGQHILPWAPKRKKKKTNSVSPTLRSELLLCTPVPCHTPSSLKVRVPYISECSACLQPSSHRA